MCTDWTGRNTTTGELLQNATLWPGGMRAFADYLHAKGLLLSVYTDSGVQNCCGEPGSLNYESMDMKTFAEWGADAVAVDFCGGDRGAVREAYQKFADGIAQSSNPKMKLLVFNLGFGAAYEWAPQMNASFFRITTDIGNTWHSIPGHETKGLIETVNIGMSIPNLNEFTGLKYGAYPMYGQMLVGVPPGHPTSGDPGLSWMEAQAHFSMWCMFPSPLLATNDVRVRNVQVERILLNKDAIDINQDTLGLAAYVIDGSLKSNITTWGRKLVGGDFAGLVLNRDDHTTTHATLTFADVAIGVSTRSFRVRDVNGQKDMGVICDSVTFSLEPHETAFVRITPVRAPATLPRALLALRCSPSFFVLLNSLASKAKCFPFLTLFLVLFCVSATR